MKNKKPKDKSGCVTSYISCIKWNRGAIPCLGVEDGADMDDLTFAMIDKICEAITPTDLSTLSLQCIIDKYGTEEPITKNILSVFKILVSNSCTIFDLVAELTRKIDNPSTVLRLDLKCIAEYDSAGDLIPYSEQIVFQRLINLGCELKTQIQSILLEIAQLRGEITSISTRPIDEKTISSCLYNSKPVSQAVNITATEVCSIRTILGTNNQLATAFSRQCSTLSSKYASQPGFIALPQTTAEAIGNLYIISCLQQADIDRLSACACKVSCEDIIVDYTIDYEDNDAILTFTTALGTNIPSDYIDCGSKLTITNGTGLKVSYFIPVANDYVSAPLDLSIFNAGDLLNFNLDLKLCSGSSTCQRCLNKQVKYTNGCCLITNTSSETVTLTYSYTTTISS